MPNEFSNAHALIIGVGEYRHPAIPNLPAAAADAAALVDLLTDEQACGYPRDQVRLLSGLEANGEALRAELTRLARVAAPDATVLVYFSGHGGRISADDRWLSLLCPSDCNPDRPFETSLLGDEVSAALAAVPAARLVMIVDACHASGAAEAKDLPADLRWKTGLPEEYLEQLSRGSGRVVIASSRPDQLSYVRPQGDHSLFTWHLLQGLRGGASIRRDGLVHVLDLFHFVSEAMQGEAANQTPLLKVSDLDHNFALAIGTHSAVSAGSATNSLTIAAIREQIVADPAAGAKALSDFLAARPALSAKRTEVDLRRAELGRLLQEIALFGPSDNDHAAKNRIIFQLLRTCMEIEAAPQP